MWVYTVFFTSTNFTGQRKRKEHLRTVGMRGNRKTFRKNIIHDFLHVPIPTALRHSLSSTSLVTHSRSHHLILHVGICFLDWNNFAGQRKRKEHLRTVGMGGIRKTLRQMSVSNSFHFFLHVPIPTALRYSLSSSSWLTGLVQQEQKDWTDEGYGILWYI